MNNLTSNQYDIVLSDMIKADIINMQKGFINNNCNIMIMSIIVKCMDNIHLFTLEQKINLQLMIYKLTNNGC